MANKRIPAALRTVLSPSRRPPWSLGRKFAPGLKRGYYHRDRPQIILTSTNSHRPRPHHHNLDGFFNKSSVARRTIFIQTQTTPNADALKFLPSHQVLPPDFPTTFVEYTSPRSTLAPPYPSPLAANLLSVDGVSSIFYGSDFITITKMADSSWAHIKPQVFSLITEAVSAGEQIVNVVEKTSAEDGQGSGSEDTLGAKDDDSEVVSMIKELLETRIRPAIQEDGGDIEYRGFENGTVLLKLRGACRTCDSSTVTLKNGIENMLMHYIEEVKGVHQVLDQEEEIAMKEFAKFEEKLRQQRKPDASASTPSKGSLDTAET